MRKRGRRNLNLSDSDPWIDIHRSGQRRQHGQDEDQKNIILGIIVVLIILVWLFA
jgi:hypothetical protein